MSRGLLLTMSLLLAIVLATNFTIGSSDRATASPQTHHWKHYVTAKNFYDKQKYAEAAHELQHANAQERNTASYFLLLAQTYEKLGKYQQASDSYYRTGEIYKKTDYNAYLVNKMRGDALATQIELFSYEQTPLTAPIKLAKHEPAEGLYIGAFVEYDAAIGPRNVQKFNQLTGKQHAVYFTYHKYGSAFPINWANQVKAAGGAIQLALEPGNGLATVKDDEYLRQFARDCKAFGAPIFLRYAAEMNGSWVRWHGNPGQYIEKFRLISRVMQEEAPNVAMVWTPNSNPQNQIDRYYPGDAWVDWVGVNMYSVRFFNGDVKQPADHVNPLDLLDYVYKTYATRKPIMVAEFAATHFSAAGKLDTTQFSINKMNMLYHGVKMKYPRVKSINWFSVNTINRNENPGRKLNNFSLSENAKTLVAYKAMIQDRYFLTTVRGVGRSNMSPKSINRMISLQNKTVTAKIDGHAWIKTYDPNISLVEYKLDGKRLSVSSQYPFRYSLDPAKISKGAHKLEVIVYDSKQRKAATKIVSFTVGGK